MAKRSRKSSLAQKVVSVAAVGTPEPVRRAMSTRWGSRLTLLAAVVLFATGVVTVQWSNYVPHLSVNRQRAEEVKEAVVERIGNVKLQKADRRDAPNPGDRSSNY
jgi:hypothetical protein